MKKMSEKKMEMLENRLNRILKHSYFIGSDDIDNSIPEAVYNILRNVLSEYRKEVRHEHIVLMEFEATNTNSRVHIFIHEIKAYKGADLYEVVHKHNLKGMLSKYNKASKDLKEMEYLSIPYVNIV